MYRNDQRTKQVHSKTIDRRSRLCGPPGRGKVEAIAQLHRSTLGVALSVAHYLALL